MIKVSDFIAKRLKKKYKINHIFMISGGGAMHLNNSFGNFLKYTCNHNEQASAICAEGYSRVNQELSVVNVTTGPAGLNCLNGLFGQWTDSVPVLYISGQVKQQTSLSSCPELNLRQLGDQEADIIKIVTPLTKYAICIKNPKEIKFHLDKAIYEATSKRKGPVWIDIPIDVQSAMIDENDLISFEPLIEKKFIPDTEIIFNKLKNAKKPLIVAGHGISLSKTETDFLKLIEILNIPVVSTFCAMDVISTANKNYVGKIGTIGQRAGNFALQNSDCILFLGTRNNIRQISYNFENFAKNAFKIIVDIDENELKKPTIKPDLALCADLKDFLPEFLTKVKPLNVQDWFDFCLNLKQKYCFENTKEYEQKSKKINPYYFINQLTKKLPSDSIIVSTNATPSICLFQAGEVKIGQRIIMNSGDASMGYGLPCAIGACINSPQKQIICLEGDGSIMMNLQELQTIKHNNLPIKIFVFKNGGYLSIQQTQKNFFDGNLIACNNESGVSVPDFIEIAKAFKIKSIRLKNFSDIHSVIKEILNSKEAILCEVILQENYTFSPKLLSRKLEDGTIVSSSLENMFPFLDRDEFKQNMLI